MTHLRSVESYAHKAAKDILTSWLRGAAEKVGWDYYAECADFSWRVNRGAPHWGVWQECPILANGNGGDYVWDEIDERWSSRPPTFDELIAAGTPPAVIIDVAVQHKGAIIAAFEINHRHPLTAGKVMMLEEMGIDVYQVPAKWILSKVRPPKRGLEKFQVHWGDISVRELCA